MSKIKVLFVGGQGRSGSTLLDRLLGQIPGFVSTGEIRHIWDRSLPEDQYCGCGQRFRQCEFWKDVLARAALLPDARTVSEYRELIGRLDRIRNIPALNRPALQSRRFHQRLQRYQHALAAVFQGIHELSDSQVIVDSSKYPSHGYLLSTLPEIELYVLHLVRDARAVAHSWTRKKRNPNTVVAKRMIPRYPVLRTALAWDISNALTQTLGRRTKRYLRIRYEDLLRRPRRVIEEIAAALNEPKPALDFLQDDLAELNVQHTIAGNPMRFETGIVKLRADLEWRSTMSIPRRFAVTALTWPWLLRYGYGVLEELHRPGSAALTE